MNDAIANPAGSFRQSENRRLAYSIVNVISAE
jgi:hypothetical protein